MGRYDKKSNTLIYLAVVMAAGAILLTTVAVVLLMHSCSTQPPEQTQPQTQQTDPVTLPSSTAPTTAPTTEPTTAPTTAPTTQPTTEPTTEPTTQPTTPPTTVPPTPPASAAGSGVAQTAWAQLGKPYLYGGTGPDGFDTSGFVYYCHKENGVSIPRSTSQMVEQGTPVAREDLQPGDIVFFYSDTPGAPQFPGIYVGDNTFVAARNSSKPVSQSNMGSSYYQEHYVCARRFG